MKKLILFIFALLVLGCAPVAPKKDFVPVARHVGVDESVGCEEYVPAPQDIGLEVKGTMTLIANVRYLPGLYMNAIAGANHEWRDDSRYSFSGEFRIPKDAQNETLDMNLQRVENFTEYHAEILYALNPSSPLYGWIWTRQELNKPMPIFYLGVDDEWHKWEIVADYIREPKRRIIRWIRIDETVIGLNIEMGTNPKAWKESFQSLIETTNLYTNCSLLINTTGVSEWRNVKLVREDLQ